MDYVDIGPEEDIRTYFKYMSEDGLIDKQRKAFTAIQKCKPIFSNLYKKCHEEILDITPPELKKDFPFKKDQFMTLAVTIPTNPGEYIFYVGWAPMGDAYWMMVTIRNFKIKSIELEKFGMVYEGRNSKALPVSSASIKALVPGSRKAGNSKLIKLLKK